VYIGILCYLVLSITCIYDLLIILLANVTNVCISYAWLITLSSLTWKHMILEVIPEYLYTLPNIEVLFSQKQSSILHKTLNENLIDKEMFLSTVAILFVIKGKQIIRSYDNESIVVQEGHLLFLMKDMYLVSDFVTDGEEAFEAILFFIDEVFIEKYRLSSNGVIKLSASGAVKSRVNTLQPNSQIKLYMDALMRVYSKTANSEQLLELKLRELLHLVSVQQGGDRILASFLSLSNKPEKRNIKSFMEENYLKNLKVEDYALLTGRSLSSFIRDFKRLYNTTPNKWLIQRRLKKANKLLTTTNLNVTDTAFEVGYENVSHFINAYKKCFGYTPKVEKMKN